MKVNIIGQIYGTSGYSNHTRGLANALNKVCDVKLSCGLPEGWERVTNDEELKMIKKTDSPDRINLIIDLPFNWKQYASKKCNIGFLVWEGDTIPLSFIEPIKSMNQVWVPSLHVYHAIQKTLQSVQYDIHLMDKIKIIPHGVDLTIFKPEEKPERPFTFLCNKGFRNEYDRGGLQHAIKSFIQEFKKGEARLILKINPAYAMPPNQLIEYMNKIQKEQGYEPGEILINYDAMPIELLKQVYNNCDVFLNPTEAEAFSLPCLEAMACGKPVITTGFGGQTDYVTEQNGWLIDYTLHEVKHELAYEGINWAKPDIVSLQIAMRNALTNKESTNQKAVNASQTVLNWTWDHSAQKAIIALNSLGYGEASIPR